MFELSNYYQLKFHLDCIISFGSGNNNKTSNLKLLEI